MTLVYICIIEASKY